MWYKSECSIWVLWQISDAFAVGNPPFAARKRVKTSTLDDSNLWLAWNEVWIFACQCCCAVGGRFVERTVMVYYGVTLRACLINSDELCGRARYYDISSLRVSNYGWCWLDGGRSRETRLPARWWRRLVPSDVDKSRRVSAGQRARHTAATPASASRRTRTGRRRGPKVSLGDVLLIWNL